MVMFTVYVLFSKDYNKIYVGFTSNIDARLFSHNSDKNIGYTKRFQPWEVIYSENFETKSEAMVREKELKSSRGRDFIRNNILKQ
jgi:putative endonuclease